MWFLYVGLMSIIYLSRCKFTIKRFAKTCDYKEYGGALFLGVKKPVVKAHGSSDEKLFEFTVKQAEQFVKNRAVEKMIEAFEVKKEENNEIEKVENVE